MSTNYFDVSFDPQPENRIHMTRPTRRRPRRPPGGPFGRTVPEPKAENVGRRLPTATRLMVGGILRDGFSHFLCVSRLSNEGKTMKHHGTPTSGLFTAGFPCNSLGQTQMLAESVCKKTALIVRCETLASQPLPLPLRQILFTICKLFLFSIGQVNQKRIYNLFHSSDARAARA